MCGLAREIPPAIEAFIHIELQIRVEQHALVGSLLSLALGGETAFASIRRRSLVVLVGFAVIFAWHVVHSLSSCYYIP